VKVPSKLPLVDTICEEGLVDTTGEKEVDDPTPVEDSVEVQVEVDCMDMEVISDTDIEMGNEGGDESQTRDGDNSGAFVEETLKEMIAISHQMKQCPPSILNAIKDLRTQMAALVSKQ